jgi:uncharacterized delta-60 repeat protein
MKKITIACFLLLYSLGFCQVLVTDPAFNGVTSGIPDGNLVYETVVQPDGKILLAGEITQYNGQPFHGLLRLNTNGSIDTSFNLGSGFSFGEYIARINQVHLLPDGKMLVAGMFTSFNGTPCAGIVRLNANGVLDTTFTSPVFNYTDAAIQNCVYDIAVTDEGKIYLGGNFKLLSNGARALVRLSSNGSLDTSFDTVYFSDSYPAILSLALNANGSVIAGGNFNFSPGSSGIAQLTANGSLDPEFYSNLSVFGTVYNVFVQPDGRVLYGGFLLKNGSYYLLDRLNSDGSPDSSFTAMPALESNTGVNRVSSIHGYMGKTLVSGWGMPGTESGTVSQLLLLNNDGSADADFSTGSGFYYPWYNAGVLSLGIQPDNKIVTAGFFDNYNDEALNGVTRLAEQTAGIKILTNQQGGVFARSSNGVSSVVSPMSPIVSVEVFDCNGKLLLSQEHIYSNEFLLSGLGDKQFLTCNILLQNGATATVNTIN